MNSLRARLLVALLSALVLTAAVASGGSYLRARTEIDRIFDYQLRQQALSVRDRQFAQNTEADPAQDIIVQVWDRYGGQIYLSHRQRALPEQRELGYANLDNNGEQWRVYAVALDDNVIQVGQPLRIRQQLATEAALRMLLPILAVVPLFGALIWWIVGRTLRPLNHLANSLSERAPSTLAPLALDGLPRETLPIARSLNTLLARLEAALSQQREFTADAAHELRTPLTAVKLQAQLLTRAQSDAERAHASTALQAGVDRCAQLIERMLTLARLEPEATRSEFVTVDLREVTKQIVADESPLALDKSIDLQLHTGLAVCMQASPTALSALIRNLIENAITYTQRGGRVDVIVDEKDRQPRLQIIDNGPGIPKEERERVFQRFFRLADRSQNSNTSGCGLGLAIVQRAAQLHGATVELGGPSQSNGQSGLTVTVTFPMQSP
ncbi:MAG: ATP-binding protein [Gammaproteobacteria bacterium]